MFLCRVHIVNFVLLDSAFLHVYGNQNQMCVHVCVCVCECTVLLAHEVRACAEREQCKWLPHVIDKPLQTTSCYVRNR